MKYAVVNSIGTILRVGTCSKADLLNQANNPDEEVVVIPPDEVVRDNTHTWDRDRKEFILKPS